MILTGAVCYAAPVGMEKARKTAQQVLGHAVTMNVDAHAQETKSRGGVGAPAYYVFSREEGGGFAIISGESTLPAVVAYSDQNEFSTADNMAPALVDFLHAYAALVTDVREGKMVEFAPRRAEAVPVVEPLCQTQWGQGDPYNALCPMDGNKRSVAGCVAIALAQILKHHEWPKTGTGQVTYASGLTGVGALSVDFSQSTYDWGIMLNTTKELKADMAAAAAVSKICYDCGVATRMEYGASSSGTISDYIIRAMYENFSYKASSIKSLWRDCYATQAEWDALWKAELDAGCPVLYSGRGESGGHQFLLDGYDSNGFVHVNWGWNGSSDGYFDITLLNATASSSFAEMQSMIVGLEPDYTGEDKVPAPVPPYVMGAFSLKGSLNLGKEKMVMLAEVGNLTYSGKTWYFGIGLFDLDGNLLKNLTTQETENTIGSSYIKNSISTRFSIPADTPEGSYIISCIFRQKGYDEWILPDMVGGAVNNQVYTEIKDGVATFGEIPSSIYNICVDENLNGSNVRVVAHEYFDVSGRPVHNVQKGIVIDRQTLSNGLKIVKKRKF